MIQGDFVNNLSFIKSFTQNSANNSVNHGNTRQLLSAEEHRSLHLAGFMCLEGSLCLPPPSLVGKKKKKNMKKAHGKTKPNGRKEHA